MRRLSLTPLLIVFLATTLSAANADFEPLDERGLKRCDAWIVEHDYRNALRLLFMILRHSEREVTRAEARERLDRLGLSSQNIFQLEIETLKPSELDELLSQVSANVAANARRDADLYYARGLLTASLIIRTDSEGRIRPDISTKDTLNALRILLEYALGENAEGSRRAQLVLEQMGINGKRVEAAKQSVKEDKLLPGITSEIIPAAIINRLRGYYEILRDGRDLGAEENPKRKVAREMGTALLQYVEKEFPESALLRRHNDALDFFRDKVHTKPDKF